MTPREADDKCASCRVLRRHHDHPEAGRDHPFREPVVECTADEYEALARELQGQSVADTARMLRLLVAAEPEGCYSWRHANTCAVSVEGTSACTCGLSAWRNALEAGL